MIEASHRARARCVLVVDDDEDARIILSELLDASGYAALTAGDGREALEVLRERLRRDEPVHAVILDLRMPVLDGPGLLAAMRDDPRLAPLPVVVVSAAPEEADPWRVAATFAKPIQALNLLRAVATVTGAVQHAREGRRILDAAMIARGRRRDSEGS